MNSLRIENNAKVTVTGSGKYAEQLKPFLQDGIMMCGYNICNGN